MMDPEFKMQEVPQEFHQDAEGKAFSDCTFCGSTLGPNDTYMIEKAFKANPDSGVKVTLYEYAICMPCSVKKMEAMSEESVQNIKNYMEEQVYSKWDDGLGTDDYREKLGVCAATGNKIDQLQEYNIVGQFVGDKMVLGTFPMAIDASLGESLQELLSESTKKEFDDFMDTITDIPPGLKELFKSKRPVLV